MLLGLAFGNNNGNTCINDGTNNITTQTVNPGGGGNPGTGDDGTGGPGGGGSTSGNTGQTPPPSPRP